MGDTPETFANSPVGTLLTEISVTTIELDDAALATETTLNAKDRVLKALQAKPAFPDELAEMTGLAHGTVVNCLTQLKRAGKVNTTGEKKGRAEEVEATPPPSVSIRSGSGGDDTTLSPEDWKGYPA